MTAGTFGFNIAVIVKNGEILEKAKQIVAEATEMNEMI